jgi:hypothetical protein
VAGPLVLKDSVELLDISPNPLLPLLEEFEGANSRRSSIPTKDGDAPEPEPEPAAVVAVAAGPDQAWAGVEENRLVGAGYFAINEDSSALEKLGGTSSKFISRDAVKRGEGAVGRDGPCSSVVRERCEATVV